MPAKERRKRRKTRNIIKAIIKNDNTPNTTIHITGLPVVGDGLSVEQQWIEKGSCLGYGLRVVGRVLPKGTLIQYAGTIISKYDAEKLDQKSHFASWCGMVINGLTDPRKAFGLGGASFANHSEDKLKRNAIFTSKENGLFLKTTREIYPGQFIWTNYGNSFIKSSKCPFTVQ